MAPSSKALLVVGSSPLQGLVVARTASPFLARFGIDARVSCASAGFLGPVLTFYLRHRGPVMPGVMRRAIVMPNLKPPVTTTALANGYRGRICAALPEGSDFNPLMTL